MTEQNPPQQPGWQPQQPGGQNQWPTPHSGYGPPQAQPQQPGGPQYPQGPYPGGGKWGQPPQPTKKRHLARNGCLGVVGLFVVFIIIGAIALAVGGNKPAANHSAGHPAAAVSTTPATASTTPAAPPPPAAPQYTVSQQSAITAAEQYLSMGSGFSKEGLIQQLDSSAGSGFSVADAKFAVSHISVNWDHQAALAAKGYMQMGGFSYSGMVQQLESSAGSGFTYAQSVFGAKSVGL
jgi:Host cell surface-exposed lipoprotein